MVAPTLNQLEKQEKLTGREYYIYYVPLILLERRGETSFGGRRMAMMRAGGNHKFRNE
jgi:hypothetical protein